MPIAWRPVARQQRDPVGMALKNPNSKRGLLVMVSLHALYLCLKKSLISLCHLFKSHHYILCVSFSNLFSQIAQMFTQLHLYMVQPMNLLDWFTYISSILVTVNLTSCGARTVSTFKKTTFIVCFTSSFVFSQRPYIRETMHSALNL